MSNKRDWNRWPKWKIDLSYNTEIKARKRNNWFKFHPWPLFDKRYFGRLEKKLVNDKNAVRTAKLLYEWRRAAKPKISKRRAILDRIARREIHG
ncbi:hypothetical protein LCGC14_1281390 [marine sediment metagenome]|uniref:Uncharacterized protein n=1 Tax=marine sediment metagenome TaxID=412755 RepID=A0A0F9KWQ3_9ZZZZ